jgi:TRAP-type C4-dicarboxylate transport system permease small subunit
MMILSRLMIAWLVFVGLMLGVSSAYGWVIAP